MIRYKISTAVALSLSSFQLLTAFSCQTRSDADQRQSTTQVQEVNDYHSMRVQYASNNLSPADTMDLEKQKGLIQWAFKATQLTSSEQEKNLAQTDLFYYFPGSEDRFDALFHDGEYYSADVATYAQQFQYNDNIGQENFLKKLNGLGSGSQWQADGLSLLQMPLQDFVRKNVPAVIEYLRTLPENDRLEFWRFYFAGPHPENLFHPELMMIKSQDPDLFQEMFNLHASLEAHS